KDPVEQIILPQKVQVSGIVRDSTTEEPLVGVTIQVKDKSKGTVTDAQGQFSLEVEDGAVLVVSYLGYSTKTIPVDGRRNLEIKLANAATGLDQVVVIGYGTLKK